MSHETPLSMIVFQKPDGTTGELDVHDQDAVHAVNTQDIVDNAVTTAKIADEAITSEKIADGAVGRDQLDPDINDAWDSLSSEPNIEVFYGSTKAVAASNTFIIPIPIDVPEGHAYDGIVEFDVGSAHASVSGVSYRNGIASIVGKNTTGVTLNLTPCVNVRFKPVETSTA